MLIGLSALHGALLVSVPSAPLVALGMWWNANTVSHNFIHLPFFRSPVFNRAYAAYLSLLLGFPQQLWRERHLAHHADRPPRVRWTGDLVVQSALVLGLWCVLVWLAPSGFLLIYLPGWLVGLALCQLQGHYEHARGTTSYYGRVYNALFFNDGFHVEHHARPSTHWSQLKQRTTISAHSSAWPPVLRWMDTFGLNGLERLVLRSAWLQRFVIDRHERAFKRLLAGTADIRRVTIVGGGLFPRTALILRRVLPQASLTIVDADASHIAMARTFLGDTVMFRRQIYDPDEADAVDLVVAPLAYVGDRQRLYRLTHARYIAIHDWIWSRPAAGVVVSWLLLKRVNLVVNAVASACARRAS